MRSSLTSILLAVFLTPALAHAQAMLNCSTNAVSFGDPKWSYSAQTPNSTRPSGVLRYTIFYNGKHVASGSANDVFNNFGTTDSVWTAYFPLPTDPLRYRILQFTLRSNKTFAVYHQLTDPDAPDFSAVAADGRCR